LKRLGGFDVTTYLKAVPLLLRNPQIALAPLLAAVANVLLLSVVPMDGGFLGFANASIVQLIAFLIDLGGLAVAIVVADAAWRYGRAPLDDAIAQSKRRGSDILIAGIGFSFLVSVAGYVGAIFGGPGSEVLTAAAFVICIYMLPAAAIGGIPGSASLQVSGERVRGAPAAATVIAIVFFLGTRLGPQAVIVALQPLILTSSILSMGVVSSLIVAALKAIFSGYVALVIAKSYEDASYGRRSY
jgi:hypothetical protein